MSVILPAAEVPGAAQETTSQDILAAVDGLEADIGTIAVVDFATEAKQDDIIAAIDGIEGELATLNGKDFATETTLNNLSGVVSARLGGSFTPFPYDYMSFDGSGSDSDIYAFYLGGSGGALQGTLTIQYTDSTKLTIANVTTVAGS